MKLITERLYLRPWKESDISAMVEMLHDKSIHRFTRVPYPYRKKDAKEYFKKAKKEKDNKRWGIFRMVDGILIGSITLKNIDKKAKKAEIGYIIHRKHRNKGYATEATKKVLEYSFNKLKLNRVEINYAKDNLSSKKVITKLGAKKEGILRQELFVGGKLHDHVINSILRKEYKDK